jgi:hypothetical protein
MRYARFKEGRLLVFEWQKEFDCLIDALAYKRENELLEALRPIHRKALKGIRVRGEKPFHFSIRGDLTFVFLPFEELKTAARAAHQYLYSVKKEEKWEYPRPEVTPPSGYSEGYPPFPAYLPLDVAICLGQSLGNPDCGTDSLEVMKEGA